MLVALLASALAQDTCMPYTSDVMLADLNRAQEALSAEDLATLGEAGTALSSGMACLDEQVPEQVHAMAYRLIGAHLTMAGDVEGAKMWFRTAMELDPTFAWDIDDVAQGSEVWNAYEDEASTFDAERVFVPGRSLSLKDGDILLLDGRVTTSPAARPGRYHVVQVRAEGGEIKRTWLIEGAAFPSSVLIASTQATVQPQNQDAYATKTETVKRNRPAAKTPLLIGGVAGLLAAGGMYAASYPARSSFDAATTEDELYAAKTRTNMLVLGSAGVAAVGVGVTVWGVAISDSGLGLAWQF